MHAKQVLIIITRAICNEIMADKKITAKIKGEISRALFNYFAVAGLNNATPLQYELLHYNAVER